MYPLKSFTDINELQLHIKNLLVEAKKCIEDQSQVNQKMYFYNFEKVSLKLHKFTIEFITHLAINQKIYNCFEQIRSIFTVLNKIAKDRKARSSRTYLNDDVFGLFASSHEFSDPNEKNQKEKEELDLIEQFMIKRNHQIQLNAFGDVDNIFKNRQRRGLEEFLSHANTQAQNLQNHLKTASVQRKNIRSTNKIGGLTKRLLLKKNTFDLETINQLDAHNKYHYEASGSSLVDKVEKKDQEIQTIFSNENIRWSKILTYCMKIPKVEMENEDIQFGQYLDKDVYGQYGTRMLSATQTQTQSMEENEVLKQTLIQTGKPATKKSATKVVKKMTYKPSNMKPSGQKMKEAKTQSVDAKDDQKEQSFILNSYSTKECPQKRIFNLQLQPKVLNQFFEPQIPKQELPNTQQVKLPLRKRQKKLNKALQTRQVSFEFKSKKQIYKEKRVELEQYIRGNKNNKTATGHILTTQRTIIGHEMYTEKQILDQTKPVLAVNKSKESLYQNTSVKENYGRKHRNERKFTWKDSINSSLTNIKSTFKIEQPSVCVDSQNFFKIKQSKINQSEENKLRSINISKTSNFKQFYNTSPDNFFSGQKKVELKKRNTIDQMMISSQIKSYLNEMKIEIKSNGINQNLIKQEQCQVSYRNTVENLPYFDAVQDECNMNGNSKRTQKSSHQTNTQTKRTQQILQSLYDKPLPKKQLHGTEVLYKRPAKPNESEELSKYSKSQKKQHKNLRVKTLGKQEDQNVLNTTRNNRNSVTFHNLLPKNHKHFLTIAKKGHSKHLSQELPDLSGCKQKLSDIKKSFSKDFFKNPGINGKSVISTSNLMKTTYLSSPIKKLQQEMKLRQTKENKPKNEQKQNNHQKNNSTPNISPYEKIISIGQANPKSGQTEIKSKKDDETSTINTIRRLLMTNSYRDKLLLYLSMIEVMHEKCCGKNCEHVKKFMKDMTGGVDAAEESVAKQLLKMYNTRTVSFQDLTNMWC